MTGDDIDHAYLFLFRCIVRVSGFLSDMFILYLVPYIRAHGMTILYATLGEMGVIAKNNRNHDNGICHTACTD